MYDYSSKNWSLGCYFVQFQKNNSYHKVMRRSPYKALIGVDPKAGFSPMNLPRNLLDKVEDKDDFRMLEEHMENENLQEELQSDEIEGTHGMGKMVDRHKDVVIAEDQQERETLMITIENTEKIFSREEFTLCITCPKDGSKCILCQNTEIIEEKRHDASRCQKRVAEKMLTNTAKKVW